MEAGKLHRWQGGRCSFVLTTQEESPLQVKGRAGPLQRQDVGLKNEQAFAVYQLSCVSFEVKPATARLSHPRSLDRSLARAGMRVTIVDSRQIVGRYPCKSLAGLSDEFKPSCGRTEIRSCLQVHGLRSAYEPRAGRCSGVPQAATKEGAI